MTVPDWLLERYALGEVTDAERASLESDPTLPAQLDALAKSNADIRQTYDGAQVARIAQQRARPPGGRPAGRPWWMLGPVLAVAAAALLYLGLPGDDGHRAKGSPTLLVHRQVAGGSVPVVAGELLRPGEVVQLEVVGAGYTHGWVVSVDGAGTVTVHNDGVLRPGVSLLPEGYRLDDAPDYEQFWLVVSEQPLERAVVEQAVAQAPVAADGHGLAVDLPDAEEHQVWVRKP